MKVLRQRGRLAHHHADLDSANLARYVDGVRTAVNAEPYEGWRDIADALDGWPHWTSAKR